MTVIDWALVVATVLTAIYVWAVGGDVSLAVLVGAVLAVRGVQLVWRR